MALGATIAPRVCVFDADEVLRRFKLILEGWLGAGSPGLPLTPLLGYILYALRPLWPEVLIISTLVGGLDKI